MRELVVVAAIVGCGPLPGATAPTAPVGGGGGPPGSIEPSSPTPGPNAMPAAAPPPGCFPARDPADPLWLDVARVDDRLVVCADDHRGGERRCWSLDAATGALAT